eukprot:TRINITY_DN27505_c0_g1_i2.p1 TRINITY_DN27505_c0_g1~~TRINITY_DN27505_c0_g1_i2.p1  ORF type:complete len:500 (+),score=167.46 TRINITY_DN27505_c0_g1_i2:47-1546(+)
MSTDSTDDSGSLGSLAPPPDLRRGQPGPDEDVDPHEDAVVMSVLSAAGRASRHTDHATPSPSAAATPAAPSPRDPPKRQKSTSLHLSVKMLPVAGDYDDMEQAASPQPGPSKPSLTSDTTAYLACFYDGLLQEVEQDEGRQRIIKADGETHARRWLYASANADMRRARMREELAAEWQARQHLHVPREALERRLVEGLRAADALRIVCGCGGEATGREAVHQGEAAAWQQLRSSAASAARSLHMRLWEAALSRETQWQWQVESSTRQNLRLLQSQEAERRSLISGAELERGLDEVLGTAERSWLSVLQSQRHQIIAGAADRAAALPGAEERARGVLTATENAARQLLADCGTLLRLQAHEAAHRASTEAASARFWGAVESRISVARAAAARGEEIVRRAAALAAAGVVSPPAGGHAALSACERMLDLRERQLLADEMYLLQHQCAPQPDLAALEEAHLRRRAASAERAAQLREDAVHAAAVAAMERAAQGRRLGILPMS